MAIETHFVNISLVKRNPAGKVYTHTSPNVTIGEALRFSEDFAVLEDINIANTKNYPTIKQYLELEAAGGFKPVQITQSFIITVKET